MSLTACGHGSSSSTTTTTTATNHISVSPSVVALIPGQVATFSIQEQDVNNTALAKQPAFTFALSNTTGLTMRSNCSIAGVTGCQVEVCAGTFDSNFINCTPSTVPVQANLTASGDSLTGTATLFVHQQVTAVTLTPASTAGCVSSGGTQTFQAKAFNTGTDITPTVGPFSWSSTQSSVVSVDNNGVATASSPGTANIIASVAGVTSLPAPFNTCAVKTINLHISGSSATSGTIQFPTPTTPVSIAADVIDANGQSITVSNLTFSAVPPIMATGLPSYAPQQEGTGAVVASCQPPACNIGLGYATYSNPVVVTATGGSVSGTVWAASSSGTGLAGINVADNSVPTTVTLPATPNSMIVGGNKTNVYLGSANGLMIVSASGSHAITTINSAAGKLLAVDPRENFAIVAGSNNVFIVTISNSNTQTLNIAGATAAAWTPDGFYAYIVAADRVTEFSPNLSPKSFTLSSPANDAMFLTSGQFAYFAQTTNVTARRPCDNLQSDSIPTAGAPQLIKPLLNGSAVVTVDSTSSTTGVDIISPTISAGTGCGQAVIDSSPKFRDFGAGVFTPTKLITTPDSNYAFVVGTGVNTLLQYSFASDATSTVTLTGGATPLSGDVLPDTSGLYIGASDGSVHQLTISNGTITDAAQVAISSKLGGNPDFVAFVNR